MNGDSHQVTFKGNIHHCCLPQTARVPEQTCFIFFFTCCLDNVVNEWEQTVTEDTKIT